MGDKTTEIINSMKEKLIQKPCSISDVADKTMNWRTAEYYLSLMKSLGLVKEEIIKNKRVFYLLDQNNYFKIPIKKEHSKLISSIYAKIKEFCSEKYNKEPTKTHVYKILWEVNKKLNLNLPIGWYRYGPICVQVYNGKEKYNHLDKKTLLTVKETTISYCKYDKIELQRMIYDQEQEVLYQIKEKILTLEEKSKQNLNLLLMDLVKAVPSEATEIVTDFVRTTLLLGWEKTHELFNLLWKYIALIRFKESLKPYYDDTINVYLDESIKTTRWEIQVLMTDLVKSHVGSKHSQEKKYQHWKKSH